MSIVMVRDGLTEPDMLIGVDSFFKRTWPADWSRLDYFQVYEPKYLRSELFNMNVVEMLFELRSIK